jgi:hypothetical protein
MDRGNGAANPAQEDDMLRLMITRGKPALAALWAGCTLLASPAGAHADPPQAQADTRDESLTTYSFEDDKVFGDSSRPLGEVLVVRDRRERSSLIRAREHYVRELLKSVEAL